MVVTLMMNPCYECPKYREYGEYLEEVLITKRPVSCPEVVDPVSPGKKKKTGKVTSKARPGKGKAPVMCRMDGCDREATTNGYCRKCYDLRQSRKRHGKPVPDYLTPEQIRRRKSKGN